MGGMLRDEAEISEELARAAAALLGILSRTKEACEEARAAAQQDFDARWLSATARHSTVESEIKDSIDRKVEETLTGLRPPVARSQLSWDDEDLKPHLGLTCGGMETTAIRVGEFTVDSEASGRERIPLTLDVLSAASFLVCGHPNDRTKILSVFQSLMLRYLVTISPGKLLLRLFDSKEHGRAFSSFIQALPQEMSGGQAGVTMRELDVFLDELDRRIASVSQRFLKADTSTLRSFNEQTPGDIEPYYLFAIDNFPEGLDEKRATRVLRIAEHGPTAGVYAVICSSNVATLPVLVKDSLFLKRCIEIRVHAGKTVVRQGDATLDAGEVDTYPTESRAETMLKVVAGKLRNDGSNTETFEFGRSETWWGHNASAGIDVPIGRMRSGDQMILSFDETGRNGALVAGGSGYGKSNLLHVIIARMMAKYDPRTLNLYLLDFKGVEFNVYHEFRPPHVRGILSDMNQKLGVAMLGEFQAILAERKRLFSAARRQKLSDYNNARPGEEPLPRIVVVIDEFQKLFMGDISMAREAEEMISNLLRQGRSYGIHLILASQNLSHQTTPRDIKTMFQTRIVLKFRSPTDYALVLETEFAASGALKERGQALFDIGGGDPTFFLIPFLPFPELESGLRDMDALAAERRVERPSIVFLNGEEVASVDRNSAIARLVDTGAAIGAPFVAWIGDAFSLRGSASLTFRRQANANLLVLSQDRHAREAYGLLSVILLQAAAHSPKNRCYVVVPENGDEGLESVRLLGRTLSAQLTIVPESQSSMLGSIVEDAKAGLIDRDSSVVVAFAGLQRFAAVRNEFQTLFSRMVSTRDKTPSSPTVGDHIKYLLDEGPRVGVHTILLADSVSGADRQLGSRFNLRVGFRLTDADSQSAFSSKAAEGLPDGFAVFVDKGEAGEAQEFRPYAPRDPDWLDRQACSIRSRNLPVT